MRAETDAGGMSGVDGDMHRCVGFKRELSSAAERLHNRAASDS
jgi:hypothetical protein